ncbi:hypothetical protein JL720_12766 [Aureococcus anophagefferens]|nr:hypothetical protein JL720_12766 [Aureococcus anophagefferens]
MPVVDDPSAVLEKQVPMYHLDDDNRYIMVMGVGPEGSDGNYTSFAPFQIPIEYDYDVLDLKHIIQAQLGFDPDDINLRCAGDFRRRGNATPSKVVRATRRLASTTVERTAGALNKGVDLVGDAVVEGAVGATATLGGKELIWKYLDLIFEDLDKKTVSVSDAGVTIAGPSRRRRVELKSSTRLQLAALPDLLPYDEVYEVLSALMDPHAAELNLVDEADASRGARRRFDRDRRDRRDVVAGPSPAAPRSAYVLDRLEGRAFVFLLMGFIVVSLTSELIWRRAHRRAQRLRSRLLRREIAARLALYGALKPRGARQFFEGG